MAETRVKPRMADPTNQAGHWTFSGRDLLAFRVVKQAMNMVLIIQIILFANADV